eukprot:9483276-Pyramimonas_sp.AAC.1
MKGSGPAGFKYPGAEASIEKWAAVKGCDVVVPDVSSSRLDLLSEVPPVEQETELLALTECGSGCGATELWRMNGPSAKHNTRFDSLVYLKEMIQWLLNHNRDACYKDYDADCPEARLLAGGNELP